MVYTSLPCQQRGIHLGAKYRNLRRGYSPCVEPTARCGPPSRGSSAQWTICSTHLPEIHLEEPPRPRQQTVRERAARHTPYVELHCTLLRRFQTGTNGTIVEIFSTSCGTGTTATRPTTLLESAQELTEGSSSTGTAQAAQQCVARRS